MPQKAREDMASGTDISDCLTSIGVTLDVLSACSTIEEEFGIIKKSFNRIVVKVHPDKGGTDEAFLDVFSKFEVLRGFFEKRLGRFSESGRRSAEAEYSSAMKDFSGRPPASWDFFASAAEETMPGHRVELSKSNRAQCQKNGCNQGCTIQKGAIRVGSADLQSGGYSRFCHLACWRVPSKIWLGLDERDDEATFERKLLAMNEVRLNTIES